MLALLLVRRSQIWDIWDIKVALSLPVLICLCLCASTEWVFLLQCGCEERRYLWETHIPNLACGGLVVSCWKGHPHRWVGLNKGDSWYHRVTMMLTSWGEEAFCLFGWEVSLALGKSSIEPIDNHHPTSEMESLLFSLLLSNINLEIKVQIIWKHLKAYTVFEVSSLVYISIV